VAYVRASWHTAPMVTENFIAPAERNVKSNRRFQNVSFILPTIGILILLFAFVMLCFQVAAAMNIPRVDVPTVSDKSPFGHPGLYRLKDGSYQAYFAADVARFNPSTMTIPVGSKVLFFVTSPHQARGFAVAETTVNMEAGPGWVETTSHVFDKPDTYLLVCSLNCGLGHEDMYAKLEVK